MAWYGIWSEVTVRRVAKPEKNRRNGGFEAAIGLQSGWNANAHAPLEWHGSDRLLLATIRRL